MLKQLAKTHIIVRNVIVYVVSKTIFWFVSLQNNMLIISNLQTEINFNISGQPQCPSWMVVGILIKHGITQ